MRTNIKKKILSLYIICKERKFYSNGTRLKYLFYKGTGNILVVIFSAYSKEKAMYNYVRSLKEFKCSKIYIKDDFGPDHTGSYYLGEKARHNVEHAVIELIKSKATSIGDGKPIIVFVGSSKGGYAALNYAVEFDNSYAIVGAPQYKLGSHLNEPFFYPMLEDIFGDITPDKISNLDDHIKRKYKSLDSDKRQHIYLQYSSAEYSEIFKEFTYEKHIRYLIEDLRKYTNIELSCEVLDYKDHNDVHKYYPDYLKSKLHYIINSTHPS